jgi:hypothetical protein
MASVRILFFVWEIGIRIFSFDVLKAKQESVKMPELVKWLGKLLGLFAECSTND